MLTGETALVTSSMDGIIQSVDKGCCSMFGYELHELPGKPLTILIPTPYKEQHDSYLENYHKTGKKKIIGKIRTLEAQHKDGTIFPIRLSVSEVKTGPTSIFFGMIQKLNDIAAIITADMTGKIISVNQYCEMIWGYSVNELVGENVRILMPNPHRDRHDSYLQNYFQSGKMKVIGKVRNVPALHKNGLIFPVCLQVSRVRINNVEYFRGRVEKVEEEREALFSLNCEGVILSCNRNTVLPLLGYTEDELRGNHINFLLPRIINQKTKKNKDDHHEHNFSIYRVENNEIIRNNSEKNIINNNNNNNNNNSNNDNNAEKNLKRRRSEDNNGNDINNSNNDNDNTNKRMKTEDEEKTPINNDNNNTTKEEVKVCPFHVNKSSLILNKHNNNNNNNNNNSSNNDINNNNNNNNNNNDINNNNNNNNNNNDNNNDVEIVHEYKIPHKRRGGCIFSGGDSDDEENEYKNSVNNNNNNTFFQNIYRNELSPKAESDIFIDSSAITLEEWINNESRFLECTHRDGSCFTVMVTITQFTTKDTVFYSCKIRRPSSTTDSAPPPSSSSPTSTQPSTVIDNIQISPSLSIGKYVFDLKKSIGAGSYGKVCLGKDTESDRHVAVKILQKDVMDETELIRSRREIEIMKQLNHSHICRLFESYETPDRLYIIMEYCKNGELFSYVSSRGKLTEAHSRNFFMQIVSAVSYCHQKNIIHRDIKHKNILLDENFDIKLIDFGLSNYTIEGGYRNTFCGTPAYSAPEMILAQKYVGPEVDIWSLGVVLFSMLTGEFPFKTVSDIINCNFTLPQNVTQNCKDLIPKMLCLNPKDRISVEALVNHPFITQESPKSDVKLIDCVVVD